MDGKARKELAGRIAALINGREAAIIPAVRLSVYNYIANQPLSQCLKIVSRNRKSGNLHNTYTPNPPDLEYGRAFIAFIRRRDLDGYVLDSGLSEPTAAVVAETFSSNIQDAADEISQAVIPYLSKSDIFVNGIVASLAESYQSTIPQQIRAQVVSIMTANLKQALIHHIDTASVTAIKVSVTKVVAASVSSPLAAKVAFLIMQSLATTLKPIILKLLASSAFKAAVLAKIKAVVVGSVIGVLVHMLAAKFGLSAGAAFAWILLPILIAWIAREAWKFPEKLASKVSEAVASDLSGKFGETSRDLADRLVEMLLVEGAAMIAREIVRAAESGELVAEAVRAAGGR